MGENIIFKARTSLQHWNFLKTIDLYVLCWFGQAHIILFYQPTVQSTMPQFIFFLRKGGENCWEGSKQTNL